MLKEKTKKIIKEAASSFEKQIDLSEIEVEHPKRKENGFLSSNFALKFGNEFNQDPESLAKKMKEKIKENSDWKKYFDKIKIASPGFINFFVSSNYLQDQVEKILERNKDYFSLKIGEGKKINVEYISANPTGPLTLGNGRGGFCGDVLANVLEKAGFEVTREYYVNDTGKQIKTLGMSVLGESDESSYQGDYIKELRPKIEEDSPKEAGKKAANLILKDYIKPTVKKMGIDFDVWTRETKFKERRKEIVKDLKEKDLAYEKNGGIWFKSTEFGDDKDRVLIRSNGNPTYFASDLAYMEDKFKRGAEKLVYFFGADHGGYIKRMKAAAQALGYEKPQVKFVLVQLVDLLKNGEKVQMSKREGNFVTLDELIEEVGVDVARFFFIKRAAGTHFSFDMNLAKKKSKDNPVYYIQYAYARIASILRKTENYKQKIKEADLSLLKKEEELELIKQVIELREIIENISLNFGVHKLSYYSMELAKNFHQFYRECQVISEDKKLTAARISLVVAVKTTLKQALDLMGISSPEKM